MSSYPSSPEISVLIPTRNRPELVKRAIASVQAQTFENYEIIVTIDGPDPETEASLESLKEPRLRWIVHPENRGLPAARETGILNARGDWIAYLDDDDEWMPAKLERQLAVAKASQYPLPIVASQTIGRTARGDFTWPRRSPTAAEPLSEYLFVRKSFFYGEATLQPSTYFVKKDLLLQTLPDPDVKMHEDWNWLFHALVIEGAGIEFVEQPLSIWYRPQGHAQMSNDNQWDYSLNWIRSVKHLVTPKAYAGFLMSHVGSQAALNGLREQFWPILSEAYREGPPGAMDTFLYLLMWILPSKLRGDIRAFVVKNILRKGTNNSD